MLAHTVVSSRRFAAVETTIRLGRLNGKPQGQHSGQARRQARAAAFPQTHRDSRRRRTAGAAGRTLDGPAGHPGRGSPNRRRPRRAPRTARGDPAAASTAGGDASRFWLAVASWVVGGSSQPALRRPRRRSSPTACWGLDGLRLHRRHSLPSHLSLGNRPGSRCRDPARTRPAPHCQPRRCCRPRRRRRWWCMSLRRSQPSMRSSHGARGPSSSRSQQSGLVGSSPRSRSRTTWFNPAGCA